MRSRRLLPSLALATVLAAVACGGGEDVTDVPTYPDLNGTWQYRSELTAGRLVCIEHGDLTLTHGGAADFSGSGTVTMECWEDQSLFSITTDTLTLSGGRMGEETPRGSRSVTFGFRPGWTYSGEGFKSSTGSFVINGDGTGVVTGPGGGPVSGPVDWTICRRFRDQADFVERVCE